MPNSTLDQVPEPHFEATVDHCRGLAGYACHSGRSGRELQRSGGDVERSGDRRIRPSPGSLIRPLRRGEAVAKVKNDVDPLEMIED